MSGSQECTPGWGSTLAFWFCLLVSVGLYAVVALAPRLHESLSLARRVQANQHYLVDLERRVARLQKLNALHDTDRALVRERARAELGIWQPREERIAVSPRLTLQIAGEAPPPPSGWAQTLPWYAAALRLPAESPTVGGVLLAGAAVTVVFSFTFFATRSPPGAQ